MRAVTRLHSNVNGSVVENVARLDFGVIKAGMVSEIRVISLEVIGVQQIANVNLEIIGSDAIDVANGGFRYFTSKTFEHKDDLPLSFDYAGKRIFVRNLTNCSTEYVYLSIDTQKTNFTGVGNVHFRWRFDILEGSSSSSSNSTSELPYKCQKIYAGDALSLEMEIGDTRRFEVFLEPTEYATLLINGNELMVENNGGSYTVQGIGFETPNDQYEIFLSGQVFIITYLGSGSFIFEAARVSSPSCSSLADTYKIVGYEDGDISGDNSFQNHLNPYEEPWNGTMSRTGPDCNWEASNLRMNGKKLDLARIQRNGDFWNLELSGPDLSDGESFFWIGTMVGGDTPIGVYTRYGGSDTTSALLIGM